MICLMRLWAAMAASTVLSAAWMVPTYVRFKQLAKRAAQGGGGSERSEG